MALAKTLESGDLLGPYRIESRLGAGGMGEVYRAVDTRLGRAVAVKVLPAHLSDDEETRRRFEREAKLVSSLQHPHICTLFDIGRQDGVDFLVMELLEGETLADRLEKGPLSLRQVLRQATEIADALGAAHQKGVVHRDLKPGNVMLTAPPDDAGSSGSVRLPRERDGGLVKLLDFGLAKLRPEVSQDSEATQARELAETVTETLAATWALEGRAVQGDELTQKGSIVGTLPYMAPEQFQGGPLDARTDIFAFGAVLYEMATGRRAFPQTHPTSLVAAILERDPEPASELRLDLPPMLSSLCARCLAKHPADRWQSMRDVGMVLRDLSDAHRVGAGDGTVVGGLRPPGLEPSGQRRASAWAWALVGAVVSAVVTTALLLGLGRSSERLASATDAGESPLVRFELAPEEHSVYDPVEGPATISPDGSRLAYVGRSLEGNQWNRIGVRTLADTTSEITFAQDEGPYDLFWSPDGMSLGYFSGSRDQLVRVDLGGGPPQVLAQVVEGRGATWSGDVVLFSGSPAGPLLRVSANGQGVPEPVTRLDESRGDTGHWRPSFLPDGRRFVFVVLSSDPERAGLHLGSLDHGVDTEVRRIGDLGAPARWVTAGGQDWLLFHHQSHLFARRIDPATLEWIGSSTSLASDLSYVPQYQAAGFSVSRNGVLAYQAPQRPLGRPHWFDRQGRLLGRVAQAGDVNLELSRDGGMLAFERLDPQESSTDIWLIDLDRGLEQRVSRHPAAEAGPVLSPDGRRLAFSSFRNGTSGAYVADVASGVETHLVEDEDAALEVLDWSPDGDFLLLSVRAGGDSDLAVFDFEAGELKPVVNSRFDEEGGRFSPDGRWIAYAGTSTGRGEIYLTPFRSTGSAEGGEAPSYRVSVHGGIAARWRADGRELFFIDESQRVARVVDVQLPSNDRDGEAAPEIGSPRELFEVSTSDWVVHPDGQRFLVSTIDLDAPAAPITVVLGWQALLVQEP